ncbi:MAG TPA: peptidoglycan binding domain-containing protein, partial [Chloroflexota bacterium]|nr:peptidoglycan binding domain-containing protein [Chloroflexota bacterium]
MGTSLHYARGYQARPRGTRGRPSSRRYSGRREPSPAQALLQTSLLIGLLAVTLSGLGGAVLDAVYRDRALPTVRFEMIPLGGLHRDEVRGVLATHLNAFESAPYVFHLGSREWRPTAAEVGLRIDLAGMADDAIGSGRTLPWPLRAFTSGMTLVRQPSVGLRAALDRAQLFAFLSAVAAEVDREPTNAALSVRSGRIVVGQAATGRRVDAATTAARVPVPGSATQARVEVQVAPAEPALSDAAIQEAQATTARILASPLTLRLGDRAWSLSPEQLGGMIEFRRVPGGAGQSGDRLAAGLAESRVAAYVRMLAADIDRPAVDAQLRWGTSAVS